MPNRADVIVVSLPPEPQRVPVSKLLDEGYALVAVAVVRLAQRDAARGCPRASVWLDQVRADVLEDTPNWVVNRVA